MCRLADGGDKKLGELIRLIRGVSQLTVYAKILCLLMTLFSAGPSTANDVYLQSGCNLKFLRAMNGSVFANDSLPNITSKPEIFSINPIIDKGEFALTIYSKETNSYICFDKYWLIKTMRAKANKRLIKRCLFVEKMDTMGAIRYNSVANQNRSLGFQKNGKPIGGLRPGPKMGPNGRVGGRKKHIDEKCFSFNPMKATDELLLQLNNNSQQTPQQEAIVTKPHQQQSNHQQQQPQQQPRNHRQREARKEVVAASEASAPTSGNSLLTSSYSATAPDQRQSPPHRHRHKHGAGGRRGKFHPSPAATAGHPNLESGFTEATSLPVAATLSSLYGGRNANGELGGFAYGKGTHRRSSHPNSYVPPLAGEPSLLPSAPSALVTKLPPKSSAHAGSVPLDTGGTGTYRKDRRPPIGSGGPSMESPKGGRVNSGKKKSANSNNGTSGPVSRRNASTKVSTMPGRDKRASG